MLNIVLFGPPGSGKGTQSSKIIENYQLIHLSTGEILREEINSKTDIGVIAKEYIDLGMLVPDKLVLRELYRRALQHIEERGVVFDGFPRTMFQAQILDRLLRQRNIPISLVIAIDVEEKELFNRLMKRAQMECRSDDNEYVIKNRIKVYQDLTFPLFNYYKSQGKLCLINGMQSVDNVFNDISLKLDEFIANNELKFFKK